MRKGAKPRILGGIELIAQEAVDTAHARVMELWDNGLGDTPIEKLFFVALREVTNRGHRVNEVLGVLRPGQDFEELKQAFEAAGDLHRAAFIEPQVQIAGWRVDFVVHYRSLELRDPAGTWRRLIVECDGHDFHERTKVQAARDRARDRTAQHEGLPVFRFTGSELWRDPMGCADEVLAFMERL